jgi:hypothetical protein
MLISAYFIKNNSTGSAGNNDEKLEQYFFDYIPGKEQVISNKEDNQGSKTLRTDKLTSNTFIADSAATRHMNFSLDGMVDLVPWKIKVKVGNSNEIKSTKRGTYKGLVIQKDGSKEQTRLSNVLVVPDVWVNLPSLMKVLKNNKLKLGSQGTLISLIIGL